MLEKIKNKYGSRFGWYTNVRGDQLNNLFASAKLVLGDVATPKGKVFDKYWSDRLPITLGRGGILVHPQIDGMLEEGYSDGNNFIAFECGNFDQLLEITDKAIADASYRENMQRNAMNLIREKHTWVHKLEQVKRTVGL